MKFIKGEYEVFQYKDSWPILDDLCETPILKRKQGEKVGKHGRYYKDVILSLDIETTRLPGKADPKTGVIPANDDISFMYIWTFAIDNRYVIYGRRWHEVTELLSILSNACDEKTSFLIFIHNLSFEFQFMKGIYKFDKDEIFAVKPRKILKCTMYDRTLEFRCSRLHSNMSLDEYTHKFNARHGKLENANFSEDGFDYTKKRYPWTELPEKDLQYCFHDVIGLNEAIFIEMTMENDNLYSFPLTSTGYVRRDVKKNLVNQISLIRHIQPSYHVYELLRLAFRGGDTHANRFYIRDPDGKQLILENVHSADRESSYPDVMCNCEFPLAFRKYKINSSANLNDTLKYLRDNHLACLIYVSFDKIELQDYFYPCPYLTIDKGVEKIKYVNDNGRLIQAEKYDCVLTDIDLQIVLSEYKYQESFIYEMYISDYAMLPQEFRNVVIDYFERKTKLKHVEGQEVYYVKSKNKINACYGLTAQNPVKANLDFQIGEIIDEFVPSTEKTKEELLQEYAKKAYFTYQWGVWVTAWARLRLRELIDITGYNFVYADTDSVKYIGEVDFSDYNKKRILESTKNRAFALDSFGKYHYMGFLEDEGTYDKFTTMGAKKYAYVKNGVLDCTISGVVKKKRKGGKELEAHGGIEAFQEGFTFYEAGGNEIVYCDHPRLPFMIVDGGVIEIMPYATIRPSTYTLSVTDEFDTLLTEIQEKLRGY